MIKRTFISCEYCDRLISRSNYSKHIRSHLNNKNTKNTKYTLDHDDLFCKFCNKELKNKNSLVQHEIRCAFNPHRIVSSLEQYNKSEHIVWNKGLTKETSESLRRASIAKSKTMKNRTMNYVFDSHNNDEIQKWLNYVSSISVTVPKYEIREQQGYYVLKGNSHVHTAGTHFVFEHDYLMNLVLNDKLTAQNTVHHIDKNGLNNSLSNLMVFKSRKDHNRFHKSDFAYLIYDSDSHLFSCELVKNVPVTQSGERN